MCEKKGYIGNKNASKGDLRGVLKGNCRTELTNVITFLAQLNPKDRGKSNWIREACQKEALLQAKEILESNKLPKSEAKQLSGMLADLKKAGK